MAPMDVAEALFDPGACCAASEGVSPRMPQRVALVLDPQRSDPGRQLVPQHYRSGPRRVQRVLHRPLARRLVEQRALRRRGHEVDKPLLDQVVVQGTLPLTVPASGAMDTIQCPERCLVMSSRRSWVISPGRLPE